MKKKRCLSTEKNNEQVHSIILDNTDDDEYHLLIGYGSINGIIHDRLWFHKVCARWVPKQFP
jgi:hypothetical protein